MGGKKKLSYVHMNTRNPKFDPKFTQNPIQNSLDELQDQFLSGTNFGIKII